MIGRGAGGANVLSRTSLVRCTDGRGQVQTELGSLAVLDEDGLLVLEVNGQHLRIPNARLDRLVEVESRSQSEGHGCQDGPGGG
jgi:hypothetical protein